MAGKKKTLEEIQATIALREGKAAPAPKTKAAATGTPASPMISHQPRHHLGLTSTPAPVSASRDRYLKLLASMKPGAALLPTTYIEPKFYMGSIVIDHVLGLDGIYRHGRVYSFHGPQHTGKSTMCYQMAAAWQHVSGEMVTVFDLEGQLDLNYLWSCGMIPELTTVFQTCEPAEILALATNFMDDGSCHLFIIDSLGRLKYGNDKVVKAGKNKVAPPGTQARTVSNFLDTLQPYALRTESIIALVNQEVGVIPQNQAQAQEMKYATISNPGYTLKGGKAAQYHPTVMLQTAKVNAKDGTTQKGDEKWIYPLTEKDSFAARTYGWNKTMLKVMKNKASGGGYREYHIWVRPGKGIDDWASVRELARRYELISYVSKKWVVGFSHSPIAVYNTEAEAIRDLVYVENMAVLVPLRVLVIEAIHKDDPRNFTYVPTDEELIAAGEKEADPNAPKKVVDFEEEETPFGTEEEVED